MNDGSSSLVKMIENMYFISQAIQPNSIVGSGQIWKYITHTIVRLFVQGIESLFLYFGSGLSKKVSRRPAAPRVATLLIRLFAVTFLFLRQIFILFWFYLIFNINLILILKNIHIHHSFSFLFVFCLYTLLAVCDLRFLHCVYWNPDY